MNHKYNPEIHHRRSIRLKDYDYAQDGAYFITVCAWNRKCLFGDVLKRKMELNECGQIIKKEWSQTGVIRSNVKLDAFVIMPNHIHGIIILVGATRWVGPTRWVAPTTRYGPPAGPTPGSIGAIIGQFKSTATKRINKMRNSCGTPVWQRNYYEHIIRDDNEFIRIREYIINNPPNWAEDENNLSIPGKTDGEIKKMNGKNL